MGRHKLLSKDIELQIYGLGIKVKFKFRFISKFITITIGFSTNTSLLFNASTYVQRGYPL
ncbi:MAG: hypothetical protein ACJAX4_001768 [Clostridium sp.]|jgi:hypothetical protein